MIRLPEGSVVFDGPTPNEIYCDGGLLSGNPSHIGGTWAFCYVASDGRCLYERAGTVEPHEIDLPTVTNNLTEFLAALLALENVPVDPVTPQTMWIFTDSEITARRIENPRHAKMNGIPGGLVQRMIMATFRNPRLAVKLVGGHPEDWELERGWFLRKGRRFEVSRHNVRCDALCVQQAGNFVPASHSEVAKAER